MPPDIDQLLDAGAAEPTRPVDVAALRARAARARRRQRLGAGLAVTVLLAVGLLAIQERGGLIELTPADQAERQSVLPATDGVWREVSPAAIGGRGGAAVVWTGEEMLVWGGQRVHVGRLRDGAAYNPSSDTWRGIADAPFESYHSFVAAWSGTEMLVWAYPGGSSERPVSGAYDPAADTWRVLPDAPLPPVTDAVGAWTGTELLVWGVAADGADTSEAAAAYDPGTDSWRELAASPLSPRYAAASTWSGHEFIVWGGTESVHRNAVEGEPPPESFSDGAAYDPTADTWRVLAPPPLEPAAGAQAVWTGHQVLFLDHATDRVQAAAYDPAGDSWRALADPPFASQIDPVWTGQAVLAWSHAEDGVRGHEQFAAYDPAADAWSELPASGRASARGTAGVWAGDQLIVWGGTHWDGAAAEPLDDGMRYDLSPQRRQGDASAPVFALPAPGEASPQWLPDGTPVFVVAGEDGTTAVVEALSTHRGSLPDKLVGWCGSGGIFQDPHHYSEWGPGGDYQGGPALTGLATYAVRVEGGQVHVGARRAPISREASTYTPRTGPSCGWPEQPTLGAHPSLGAGIRHTPDEAPWPTITPEQVAEHDGPVVVSGTIINHEDGSARMCAQPSVGPPPRCPPDSPHVTGAEPSLQDSAHTGTYVALADDGDLHSPANFGDVDSEYFGPRPRSYSDSDPISVEDGVITVPAVELAYGRPPSDPIPAGPYELRLDNRGDLGHALVNNDLGIDLVTTPGQQAATTVDLSPGEYLFYCRITGHRDAGMELELVVQEKAQGSTGRGRGTPVRRHEQGPRSSRVRGRRP